MPVVDTSLLAYTDIKAELGSRQKAILDVITYLGTCTNSEISKFSGLPINVVTPRVFELREKKCVVLNSKRECKVTGRLAMAWSRAV